LARDVQIDEDQTRTIVVSTEGPNRMRTTPSRRPQPARHHGPESIGRFAILDVIGRGGMGELYLGWDDQLDRKVAIKLVHSRRHSELSEQRLLREAKVLGQLSHPNVVSVFEVGHFEERVFVAMEFVEGVTLRAWLRTLDATGAARTKAILACFATAGRGLAAVHAAGLAHRDFKPENVLVGSDDRVRIVDFGLARSLHEHDDDSVALDEHASASFDSEPLETPTLTEHGALIGTPRYLAPEQWLGRRGDAHSDQFSFCVALFEALFEMRPFEAATIEQLSQAVQRGELRPMPRRAEVPQHVREALLRGLSVTPSERFPSMDDLLAALLPAPSRRPWLLAAIACACALLLGSAAWLQNRGRPDSAGESYLVMLNRELVAAEHLARAEAEIATLASARSFVQADRVFHNFAELPAHAGTSALARGWLHQAERLNQRGELEAELAAYATVYVSNHAEHQQQALFGLARAFMRTRQWQHLEATLDALDHGTLAVSDPQRRNELQDMRVAVLAARRDLAGAARVLEPDGTNADADTAILRTAMLELGRTEPTEHQIDGANVMLAELAGLDLDGDQVGELLLAHAGATHLTIVATATPGLPELGHVELDPSETRPITDPLTLTHDGQAFVAVRRENTLSLFQLDRANEPTLRAELLGEYTPDQHNAASWTIADLDRDQALELYLGLQAPRRMLAIEPRPDNHGRWLDPHPATTATDSIINKVAAADLDGDGDQELAVAVGEWTAYDLRIFGIDAEQTDDQTTPPSLQLLGRHKLGAVFGMALLPAAAGPGQWIAVGVTNQFPSRRVFPAETPSGQPGLHLLAWDGTAIQVLQSWDLPAPSRLYPGDFDGNGLHDLALGLGNNGQYECSLMLQIRPGEFRFVPVRELWPVGVIDLDHDGDDELLAIEADAKRNNGRAFGSLYVLGRGARSLPTLAKQAAASSDSEARRVLQAANNPALHGAIARAEELATIGLPLRAADNLSALARVADERLAAHLHVRAAELFAAHGHRLEAANLGALALAEPGVLGELRGEVLDRAIESYTQVHRFDQAAELAAAALRSGDERAELRAEFQRLHALAEVEPRIVFDFESPLDEHWSIDPLAVRRQQGRLELSLGGAEQGVIARRELEWDGGRLALEVEFEVDTLEWSSDVTVELRPLDRELGDPLVVGVSSWGGGGLYQMQLRCAELGQPEPGGRGTPFSLPDAELPAGRRHFRFSTDYVEGGDQVWCIADGEGLHVEGRLNHVAAPGRYELRIYGTGYPWARAKANIERITIVGARDIDTPRVAVDARGRLGRELAEGRPEVVLAELDADRSLAPREHALLRFLALDELGRSEQAELALAEALGLARVRTAGHCRHDPATATLVGQLLRHRPERLGPSLRALCRADDYFPLLFQAWSAAIYQHPDSKAVGRVLTTQTTGLERWLPSDPNDRLAALILLRTRARAWMTERAHGAVRSELERAVELASRWLEELDEHDETARTALAIELALARTDLAAELFDRGDEQRAREHLRLALLASPTPEILADRLVFDRRFAGLCERPGCPDLLESARTGRPI
jgi:tRNA A-37 threonylcarbamoyl transferase component Bud32